MRLMTETEQREAVELLERFFDLDIYDEHLNCRDCGRTWQSGKHDDDCVIVRARRLLTAFESESVE